MSALARENGWRGFDGIGEKVDGGWLYRCDGMPTAMGCGDQTITTRRLARVGTKSSGWLVEYGLDDPDEPGDDGKGHDTDVVLTFCPKCAAVVRQQDATTAPTLNGNR